MKYKVNEIFRSLQGEGFNTGLDSVFIRLSGCNLICPFCDTNHQDFTLYSILEIYDIISQYDTKNLIITGGEPTIHSLKPLLGFLKDKGFWIAIETNGTNNLNNIRPFLDYISISPKGKINNKKCDELRVLAGQEIPDVKAKHYFISPIETNGEFNIIESVKQLSKLNQKGKKKWNLSLQIHKLIGIR